MPYMIVYVLFSIFNCLRGAERVDAGIYTCHADTLSATTTLRFHTESEALEKYLFREEANARDPEFIDLFRHTIKQTGSNRKEEYTEPYLVKHIGEQLLPLKFITEDWGPCSKSCGGAGLQSRQITCELNLDHYYIVVDDSLCYNKGGDKPLATQDCGFQVCPEWELGVWSSEVIALVYLYVCVHNLTLCSQRTPKPIPVILDQNHFGASI